MDGRDPNGNLPPLSGIFPDFPAPIVRTTAGQRELSMVRGCRRSGSRCSEPSIDGDGDARGISLYAGRSLTHSDIDMADNESAAVKAANKHFRPSAEVEELRGTGSGAVSQASATAEKTARLKAARLERDATEALGKKS